MTEPVIRLFDLTHHIPKVIDNCKWRIKTFVERDAYLDYD